MRFPLLPFLLLAACSQKPLDPRGVGRDEVLVQVVATGRAEARPDEARFTAGVQTIAPTAAAASAGNNEVMNRVATALRGLGVGPDDLQTRQITLSRIDYGPERGRFQANNMIEVRLRDVNRAGEAIAATTQAGANVLSGPNLTVSDREAATRSAYAQAFKAARARAETYAEAAGLKVARVLAIRDGEGGGAVPYEINATAVAPPPPMMEQARASPPVQAGVNSATVCIHADFALAAR
jgi:uncharacterized protein YggE